METTNTFIDQLLGLPFTVGLVFLAAGLIQRFFPPKKINSFYGYRTTNSMRSQPRWEFAQQYSSGLMMLAGFFLLLASLIKLFFNMSESLQLTLSLILLAIAVVALIVLTEKAIKAKFPQSE